MIPTCLFNSREHVEYCYSAKNVASDKATCMLI